MPLLKVVIASTRPGRAGLPIGKWFFEAAKNHGKFTVELIDLAAENLPFLDEPNHPRLRKYTKEHTLKWSAKIDEADAFVFVTPEYNHGYPAPLKNAIDFLLHEWAHKPVGMVGYGGVSGGIRAIQELKPVLTCLSMMPLFESVIIPFFKEQLHDGVFHPKENQVAAANLMLDELLKWTEAMKPLRGKT